MNLKELIFTYNQEEKDFNMGKSKFHLTAGNSLFNNQIYCYDYDDYLPLTQIIDNLQTEVEVL